MALAALPGGTLDPTTVPKFVTPMLIPPVMPRAGTIKQPGGKPRRLLRDLDAAVHAADPAGGPADDDGVGLRRGTAAQSNRGLLIHHAPSLTIEATANRPVRVKWINDLVDDDGNYLPHLLPVDPTLHWANPPGGTDGRDSRPTFDVDARAPTRARCRSSPTCTAPSASATRATATPRRGTCRPPSDIPAGYATEGHVVRLLRRQGRGELRRHVGSGLRHLPVPEPQPGGDDLVPRPRARHDAAERLRGAGRLLHHPRRPRRRACSTRRTGLAASLPGPAPRENDKFPPNKPYREIPIAIQDRSFNADGSLFYPDTRAFFDGIVGPTTSPTPTFSPIWNPEFFGNTIMVNGNTWPFLTVEQRRYRFRFLNGCQSRFLILDFNQIPGVEVWQIGNEGGFLAAPVNLTARTATGC